MRKRAILGTALSLSLLACGGGGGGGETTPTPTASPASAGRIAVPAAGQLYHSVYPGGVTGAEDDLQPADVDAYEAAAGRRVVWVYFSHNWYAGRAFPTARAAWIRARGSVPFVRLMLRSSQEQNVAEPTYNVDAILAGTFDADLQAWGDAAAAFASPLIAEWGTEVNGEWFSWNGIWSGRADGARKFREAFRHIVRTIRARGANNITWVFHANNNDVPADDWNRIENYYPGDDVVDWLGVSVYGAQTPSTDEWPLFTESLDAIYPRLVAMAPGKPLFVLEFGVSMGNPLGDATVWADEALSALLSGRWPAIRGFSWWNETWENGDGTMTNMRVQDIRGMAAVFQSRLAGGNVLDRPLQ